MALKLIQGKQLNVNLTGSFSGSFTGNLTGTSSLASNAVSSSYALSSSFAISSSYALSSSFATSASWAPLNAGGSDTQIQFNSGSKLIGTGSFTFIYTSQSLQQGKNVVASGLYSHAEGDTNVSSGNYSHAEGGGNSVTGLYAHGEGQGNIVTGQGAHGEGQGTTASGTYSHAEGQNTTAQALASHAEGHSTIASGDFSHAEGEGTSASGTHSHAEGENTVALGNFSHAEGESTQTIGIASHAEGSGTVASGSYSHAEGNSTTALGSYSHAEGESSYATGYGSHAEGDSTQAQGNFSHTEGANTVAVGPFSHAEGAATKTVGNYSHAEGIQTKAIGNYSHAEGRQTSASGDYSHAEGGYTYALGEYSHAEGAYTSTTENYSHAEGFYNSSTGLFSHAEGLGTVAAGTGSKADGIGAPAYDPASPFDDIFNAYGITVQDSLGTDLMFIDTPVTSLTTLTAAGYDYTSTVTYPYRVPNLLINFYIYAQPYTLVLESATYNAGTATTTFTVSGLQQYFPTTVYDYTTYTVALGDYSHAEGESTKTYGRASHAEGYYSIASGSYSHAEGNNTLASGVSSHAEGYYSIASGNHSHAEGQSAIASGTGSHAEGAGTIASGPYSHTEGMQTQARGTGSHAEGINTIASGSYSHAEGNSTVALGQYQHVQGQFNISSSAQSAFIIGNGIDTNNRSNLVFASGSQFQITGSLKVSGSITGSLFGTSSYALGANSPSGSDYEVFFRSGSKFGSTPNFVYNLISQSLIHGVNNTAGEYAYVQGQNNNALGQYSHAVGAGNSALGNYSFAGGTSNITYASAQFVVGVLNMTSSAPYAFIVGNGTSALDRSNLIFASGSKVEITGSLGVSQGITGSLFGTASWASNAVSSSYAQNATNALTASYLNTLNQNLTFNGNLTLNGTASISYLDVRFESASVIYSSGSNQFGDAANDTQTLYGAVIIPTGSLTVTGSVIATQGFTGSLFGTSSWANNAISSSYAVTASYALSSSYAVTSSYSNTSTSASYALSSSYALNATTASGILGGKAPHIPYFETDTTLATSSLYQSGSSTVIINQDNATSANPEALYVWQPSTTSFNVISGKGNLNNYLQLNIQNTNNGTNASSDVVATANNGNESSNYIDMGINNENYTGGFIGDANDAYLYSTGLHLHIGNASNEPVMLFAGGTDVDVHNKLILNPDNQHQITGSLDISGSLNVRNSLTSSGLLTNGTNTVLGATVISGSSTIQGITTMTGSLLITGSTTQIGNNTLLGNTVLSGSIIISGSTTTPSVSVYGNITHDGYLRFNPVTTNIDTSISASYIYVSGSTNDLYFAQNSAGYANTTRLRWLEGNLYTGLLNGGLITTQSSTVYRISSGSGIVVNLNASYNDNPYPTVTYVNWPSLSASIAPLSASYDQSFVSIQSDGSIYAQGTPYTDGQFNTLIPIGVVVHQNHSTINATQTFPSVAYGWKQRSSDFIRAFGPVKIAGYTLSPSGSSTGSLVLSGGTSFVDGRNYIVDPNNPSYINELVGISTSKIYRYYQSGSAAWVYNTNAGAGYGAIDPSQYARQTDGTLQPVASNDWSIQRVYYFPNSATKAFYIYYGNATYASKADAIAALTTEPFNEAPNTAANAIFVGYLLLRNNADFTVAASYEIRAAGLFRGSGTAIGGGSATVTTLAGLSDVSLTSLANHNLLAYNSGISKWENVSTITANVTGNLTGTASFASTASYIDPTFISASAAASGFGSGGGGSTSGLLTTASFNAYTGSSISQFAGTASFATTAQNVIGSVTTAATASYSTNFTVANTLILDETLTDFIKVNSTIVGTNNLFQQATGSYTSAHGKYTLSKGTNARAGEFVTVWNDTSVTYFDNSTTDIGNTSDITFTSQIVTSQLQLNAVAASSGWSVKMLVTYL